MTRTFTLATLALVLLGSTLSDSTAARTMFNFRAHLSGRAQVPTPVDTRAHGEAIFQVSPDGDSIEYRLIVANLENVFMAHIHLAPANQNGPIVAWLYPEEAFPLPPASPPASHIPGPFSGVLATGTITADDLTAAFPGTTIADLVERIRAGETYVNVHTSDFTPPNNTGPGDFPGGEIRGQIR